MSGSIADTSNWLRPRRRSTSADHVPSGPALIWYGSRPGVAMLTVPPAIVVPRNVYELTESSTSMTVGEGSVTAIDGGLAKRRTWIPR